MKNKILLTILAIALAPVAAFSQIDIVPTYGYNFGAKINGYSGGFKMKGAETFGINLDYKLDEETAIQFSYTNTQSYINVTDYSHPSFPGIETKFSDVSENYFLLGVMRSLITGGRIEPYGSFSLGAAYYNFTNIDSYYYVSQTDVLRFAIGFGLGTKIMISERVGIDIHVRGLAPISWGGIGIGVGTGGVSAGAYAGSTFISGDVGGGLVIRLGN